MKLAKQSKEPATAVETQLDKLLNSAREAAAAWCAIGNEAGRAGYVISVSFYNTPDGEMCAAEPKILKRIV